jgi:O-antigen/teichoic acid export membrane protein
MLIENIYLDEQQAGRILTYGIIVFAFQLLAVGVPPILGYGLDIVIKGLIAATLLKFIWLLLMLTRFSTARFNKPLLKQYISLGAPLVLSTLLSSAATYIDGFIITSNFSPDDLPFSSMAARELPLHCCGQTH